MYLGQEIEKILPGNVAIGGANMGMVPLFAVMWCPNRAGIWAGYVAADGQELSQNLYPDAFSGIGAGNVPTTSASNWLSDPTARGAYVEESSPGMFRVPDLNGKSAGSLGAVFLRGDGTLSAAIAGVIQPDAFQGHKHDVHDSYSSNGGGAGGVFPANVSLVESIVTGVPISDGVNGTPRTSTETRPLNVTGCWIIKLFGAVTNVGSADAAQLATDYASLSSRTTSLESRTTSLESGIKQMPELLWSGSVGSNGVALNLSRPLVAGDMIWLQHNDAYKVNSHPLILTSEMLAGRYIYFSFSSGGGTGVYTASASQLITTLFTSGYGIEKVYASRAKN